MVSRVRLAFLNIGLGVFDLGGGLSHSGVSRNERAGQCGAPCSRCARLFDRIGQCDAFRRSPRRWRRHSASASAAPAEPVGVGETLGVATRRCVIRCHAAGVAAGADDTGQPLPTEPMGVGEMLRIATCGSPVTGQSGFGFNGVAIAVIGVRGGVKYFPDQLRCRLNVVLRHPLQESNSFLYASCELPLSSGSWSRAAARRSAARGISSIAIPIGIGSPRSLRRNGLSRFCI